MTFDSKIKTRRDADVLFSTLVASAESGDPTAANFLVDSFVKGGWWQANFDDLGGVPTQLTDYIVNCLASLQSDKFRNAATHFNISRPANRPASDLALADLRAVRAYRVLLARGKGVEAARYGASEHSGLTEDRVRYLLETHPARQELLTLITGMVPPRTRLRLMKTPPRKKYQRTR